MQGETSEHRRPVSRWPNAQFWIVTIAVAYFGGVQGLLWWSLFCIITVVAAIFFALHVHEKQEEEKW